MKLQRVKLHLVDGTYELFRSYYGAPGARTAGGREVGASRGMLRTLASLLREPDVTHVGVAFDTRIESFRNELYAGYKTGDGVDPELLAQFPLAERAAAALGITVWQGVEFEADDLLASAATRFRDEVEQVVLCSPDKDLTQCVVADDVVMLDRRRGQVTDEDAVRERYGIAPASIPDWLGLVGDSADGFPGVPRWGAKSASLVLARYAHIEAIPADAADWDVTVRGAAGLAASLAEHHALALLCKRLATLRTDAPLAPIETLDDLRWRGVDLDLLEALCDELEFVRFLEEARERLGSDRS